MTTDCDTIEAGWENLLEPVQFACPLPTPLYGAMIAIWQLRPALQRRFPLFRNNAVDHWGLLAWCATRGRRDYAVLREIGAWNEALAQPVGLPRLRGDEWGPDYSLGMLLFSIARGQFQLAPVVGSGVARRKFAREFWRGRRHDGVLPVPDWQLTALRERFGSVEGLARALTSDDPEGHEMPAVLVSRYRLEDLRVRFDEAASERSGSATVAFGRPSLSGWVAAHLPVFVRRTHNWLRRKRVPELSEIAIAAVTGRIGRRRRPQPRLKDVPFGVNLFGYAHGELGLGEDVRMVALALESAGVPFCIINLQPGTGVSQGDRSATAWISRQPRYAFNLFCTTGIEHVRSVLEGGIDHLRGRYTIGMWPWELPCWPRSWMHAYNLVDELWGISRYTASAYSDAPVPVVGMTLPVVAEPVSNRGREAFGLPSDDFLFLFSFDLNSTLGRKNPEAVIDAFQKAFGTIRGIGLVIKIHHVDNGHPGWHRLRSRIAGDQRMHLISGTLRRPDVLALYAACDCFVSLHRAEGFGRGLAEALLLGKQVIATDFSGNLDFCHPDRVELVRFVTRAVEKGEYFCPDGQYWAEPDIEHAAELMRRVVGKPKAGLTIGHDFSPEHAGQLYLERLRVIAARIGVEPGGVVRAKGEAAKVIPLRS